MFGWLLGWRRNLRYVFHYRDGFRARSADPVEVERVLILHLGESWRKELAKIYQPKPAGVVGLQAAEMRKQHDEFRVRVLQAINKAFDVQPYRDGEGLTEVERLGLLNGYIQFCTELVKAARPFVNAQSRASPSPESPPPSSERESSSPEQKSVEPEPVS